MSQDTQGSSHKCTCCVIFDLVCGCIFLAGCQHGWSDACAGKSDSFAGWHLAVSTLISTHVQTWSDHAWARMTMHEHAWAEHAWPRMTMHDHAWPFMTMHKHACPHMTHAWPRMTTHDHAWTCMNTHNHACACMSTHDHAWPRMTTHEHAWPIMTTHELAWPRMTCFAFSCRKLGVKPRWLSNSLWLTGFHWIKYFIIYVRKKFVNGLVPCMQARRCSARIKCWGCQA